MIRQDTARLEIPDAPGVYYFLGPRKKVLYVGRATSLKDRVRSYFSKDIATSRGAIITEMIERATDVIWSETDSVLEAIILEANEIKHLQPNYNTKEKSNKSFNYLVITKEPFPRLVVIRQRDLLQKNFDFDIRYTFGPFPNGTLLKEALKIIRKIFPFRDGKNSAAHNDRFYQQLKLAPNTSDELAKKEYTKTIQHIRLFFEGKKKCLISRLEKEMSEYAQLENFEKAKEKRDQIFALQHIKDVSLIKQENIQNTHKAELRIEGFDIAHMSGENVVGVMTVVEDGEVDKSAYRKFIIRQDPGVNDTKALKEVLRRRLERSEWQYPRLFVVDGSKAQLNAAQAVLNELGIIIPIVAVVKNERHQPQRLIGDKNYIALYEREILLVNSEAHRFAISFYRQKQRKSQFKK